MKAAYGPPLESIDIDLSDLNEPDASGDDEVLSDADILASQGPVKPDIQPDVFKLSATPAPAIPGKLKRVLIVPDTHVPYEDGRAWNLMLQCARDWKPDTIVILGDFGDFYSVSSHDKRPDRVRLLDDEVASINVRLTELDGLNASEKYFIAGNHEDRLERYLTQKAPELFNLVKVRDLFKLDSRGWKYTPYKSSLKLGKVNFTHDCGNAGAQAHMKALATFQHNVVIGHCLPVAYEVLTPKGFVRLDEVVVGDTVLAYENGQVIETPVLEQVEYDYDGQMAVFDNNVIAQRMTDRHHLYTADGRYIPVKEAVETLTKADLVRYSAPMAREPAAISDDWLRLIVAYAADGSRSSKGSLRFHLKKERKIERLSALWTSVGGTLDWAAPGKNGGRKSVGLDRATQLELLRLCPDKRLPPGLLALSAAQRQVVVDELVLWDGSILIHEGTDHGSKQFASFKPDERDLVQMLLAQHGIRSTATGTVVSWNTDRADKTPDATRKLKSFVTWEHAKERVGCITTRAQNFFVRTTEGRVELTGNTHRMSVAYEGNAEGESHVGAMFGWLGDVRSIDYLHQVQALRGWQIGFGAGWVEPSGVMHLAPIPIVNYSCVLEGKLYRG